MVSEFDRKLWDAEKKADAVLPRVEFVKIEHWNTGSGMKAYVLKLDGVTLGTVEGAIRHSYKKAGRLRYGDTYAKEWQPRRDGGLASRYHTYPTRKEAVLRLLRDLYLDGTLK